MGAAEVSFSEKERTDETGFVLGVVQPLITALLGVKF